MQYPLYVRRIENSRYHGSFPDFPRATVSGGSFEELRRDAQIQVQRVYHRSDHLIPSPTDDMRILQLLAMDDGTGLWIFVEIDLTQVRSRMQRCQFNLDELMLREIDTAARARHVSRAIFVDTACEHELEYQAGNGAGEWSAARKKPELRNGF